MTGPKPREIIALDLLRFVSAILVVAFHFGSAFARAPGWANAETLGGLSIPDSAVPWTWFGWIGVELFFVISGFVIAMSADGASRGVFLRRRALRLLPSAWICATATLLALMIVAPVPGLIHEWLRSIGFWLSGPWIDPSYWTLGIEVIFYAVIAATLGRAGSADRIERCAVLIGGLSTAFWLFAVMAGWVATPLMDYRPAQLMLLPHGCFFALGVLAWAMLNRGATARRVLMFAIFFATALAEIVGRTIERTHALGVAAGPLVPILIFAAGLGVVLGSARLQRLLAARVDARLAATLGLMTYPLYLLHQEVGAAILSVTMRQGVPFPVAIGLALAIVLVAAWCVVRFAEPVLRGRLAALIDGVVALSVRRGPVRDIRPNASPPTG